MQTLRILHAKKRILEDKKRQNAIKTAELYSKRGNAGIALVNQSERQLQNMAQTQSFAGLLYESPQFVKGMYMFIRGYRIFAEKYNSVYSTSSNTLRKYLDAEKQIFISTIPTMICKIQKLKDWLPRYNQMPKVGESVKQKSKRGIIVCDEMIEILEELKKISWSQ